MKLSAISLLLLAAAPVYAEEQQHLRGVPTRTEDNANHQEQSHRVLSQGRNGLPSVVEGNLGNIGVPSHAGPDALKNAAANAMKSVAQNTLGISNPSDFQGKGKPFIDPNGSAHIRLSNVVQGQVVEGASVVLHVDADGNIFAMNGEIISVVDESSFGPMLSPFDALDMALGKAGLTGGELTESPKLTYVRNPKTGNLCRAWKAPYFYETSDGDFLRPHRDDVYADAYSGYPCAVFPKIYAALSMVTQDCNSRTRCSTVTTSTNNINTGDAALDAAHNYAIATYNYYFTKFGRDSIDDAGMTLRSRVHYNRNYNNAFWDGFQMTYGDGDGTTFIPLSQDADVVGHELTHGVTERTSNLVYSYESGALNEAMSDIFGAAVDAFTGATGMDIWKIGEDIYTPGTSGDALRYMYDPVLGGDYDWYPTRYTGTQDNGGVHWNSGIANLAFYLLSVGGTHPRGKSNVVVPSIGMDNAAKIFYHANVNCLSSGSNFAAARYCTADVMGTVVEGQDYTAAVHAAWDAVGVPNNGPPPPPPEPISLTDGVTLTGQNSDSTWTVQQYTLDVLADYQVLCEISASNGDADLYLRYGSPPDTNPNGTWDCASYSSNSIEACNAGVTPSATTLYASVDAFSPYVGLSITCTSSPSGGGGGSCSLAAKGDSCNVNSDCCSGSCGGKPGQKTCK